MRDGGDLLIEVLPDGLAGVHEFSAGFGGELDHVHALSAQLFDELLFSGVDGTTLDLAGLQRIVSSKILRSSGDRESMNLAEAMNRWGV